MRQMNQRAPRLLLDMTFASVAVACLVAPGCRDSRDPNICRVSGTVTFDGTPVEEAELIFEPVDQRIGPAACSVKKGSFRMLASRGEQVVSIRAYRDVPLAPGTPQPAAPPGLPASPPMDRIQILPERYNRFTELKVEVKKSGDTFTFDLDSKPDPKKADQKK
jgi:hypothetical protein